MSVTGDGQDHQTDVDTSTAFDCDVRRPETSKLRGENTSGSAADVVSRRRRKLLNDVQEAAASSRSSERRLAADTALPPRASFSAFGTGRGLPSGVVKGAAAEFVAKQRKEAGCDVFFSNCQHRFLVFSLCSLQIINQQISKMSPFQNMCCFIYKLPLEIRSSSSFASFKRKNKTYYFFRAFS